jgi:hypothetical protein
MPTDGPDLSEFFKLSRPKKPPCRVGFAATQLKPAQRTQLEAACGTDTGIITTGAIVQWLANHGHEVNAPAVTSHRRNTCTCNES